MIGPSIQRQQQRRLSGTASRTRTISWLCLLLLLAQLPLIQAEGGDDSDDMVKVIVGFATPTDKMHFEEQMIHKQTSTTTSTKNKKVFQNMIPFKRTNTVAITLSQDELDDFTQSGVYSYIEPDYKVQLYDSPPRHLRQRQSQQEQGQRFQRHPQYPDRILQFQQVDDNNTQQDFIPYGILTVLQANTTADVYDSIPPPPPAETEDDCFRVCVIDTGLFVNHPDIPFEMGNSTYGYERINGMQFGLPPGQFWYNPSPSSDNEHGTHVTGTIFADGSNNEGVVGVIPNAQGMCLSIVRIFSDGDGTTSLSSINQGVEWCADQNSRVINMSLGRSGDADMFGFELYSRLWNDENVLVVSAAGNDGDTSKAWPASHVHVVSVGAVDEDNAHASFSQRNDRIDLAAPGVDVLSTSVGNLQLTIAADPDQTPIGGFFMQFSKLIEPNDTAIVQDALEYVDCELGFKACSNARNKACLIERGETFFVDKAYNCELGGGVLAFIYNNEPGRFGGSLGPESFDRVSIPVISLSRETGLELLEFANPPTNVLRVQYDEFGYTELSGTSMASPHVAGVAARIWAARPACTNVEIKKALLNTAKDLGEDGRDDRFGHGLVQGLDAYNFLLALEEPCGLIPKPSMPPSSMPSDQPSEMPSGAPSSVPSTTPTSSQAPSMSPTIMPVPTASSATKILDATVVSVVATGFLSWLWLQCC